jgi:hypothetical protein
MLLIAPNKEVSHIYGVTSRLQHYATQGNLNCIIIRVLCPRNLIITHWRRRSEGRNRLLSHPMGFEKRRERGREDLQLRYSHRPTQNQERGSL